VTDISPTQEMPNSASQLLAQGAGNKDKDYLYAFCFYEISYKTFIL
jgi:hypothetical protein